jgi:putative exporter of polyketide antibiotics
MPYFINNLIMFFIVVAVKLIDPIIIISSMVFGYCTAKKNIIFFYISAILGALLQEFILYLTQDNRVFGESILAAFIASLIYVYIGRKIAS